MKTIIRLISIVLLILILMSVSAAFIPSSVCSVIALSGLGFQVFWALNSLMLLLLILLKIRWLRLVTFIILLLTGPLFLRYYSLPLKKANKDHTYSLIDFNTFGLRTPVGESEQYDNQDSIHNYINQSKYTVACFQEYPMKGAKHAKFYEKLHDGLDLSYKALSEYSNDEKSTQLILVTASAYPIINEDILYYNSKPFALITDIKFPEEIIRVYNIHLQSVKLTKERKLLIFDDANHGISLFQQLREAVTKLNIAFLHRELEIGLLNESIKKSPYTVIVSGDFNDTPASYTYHKISAGLKDASMGAAHGFKRTYRFSTIPLNIDYILHAYEIKSSGYKQIPFPISDHFAISTNFKIATE